MTDLSTTIDPKTDQLNADSLIAGPITITVTKVVQTTSKEQPIKIFFEGDNGKPYLPGLSMRRVLVQVWGRDGSKYVGRAMTLYRDPDVKWAGEKVGGIRISHVSHIDKPMTFALTETRGSRKPFTVQPLVIKSARSLQDRVDDAKAALKGANTLVGIDKLWKAMDGLRAALTGTAAEHVLNDLQLTYDSRRDEIEAAKEK